MAERYDRREFLRRSAAAALTVGVPASLTMPRARPGAPPERRLLYVASPGIRNYVEWGGVGVLVYDVDDGHRLVRRIPTLNPPPGGTAENVKGVCASVATGKLYVSTPQRLLCLDLLSERLLWNREYEGGCDRMSITPDGAQIYLPSFEGPHWHVVDGRSGAVLARIELGSGAHNTIVSLDGGEAYLAGLRSPRLAVADTRSRRVVRSIGPFTAPIRPFTVDGARGLCFVNVNERLGFEVGDLRSGRVLHRVEVEGYQKGPLKRHGCPSHGIGLTPDGGELWVSDGANSRVHVFDATVMPPRQVASIALRDQPGWVTFGLDGRYAYPSTGEVIDTRSREIVARLADERGGPVQSEKLLEIRTVEGRPVRVGDQFGLARSGRAPRAG
jgi:DNA-binding beta-propeller fold protein YncE